MWWWLYKVVSTKFRAQTYMHMLNFWVKNAVIEYTKPRIKPTLLNAFHALYALCPYITRHSCLFLHSLRFG